MSAVILEEQEEDVEIEINNEQVRSVEIQIDSNISDTNFSVLNSSLNKVISVKDIQEYFKVYWNIKIKSVKFIYDFKDSFKNILDICKASYRLSKYVKLFENKDNKDKINFKLMEELRNTIVKQESIVKKKLGNEDLKQIDFYDLKGFRKVDCFVVFENTSDKLKILNSFQKVNLTRSTHLDLD